MQDHQKTLLLPVTKAPFFAGVFVLIGVVTGVLPFVTAIIRQAMIDCAAAQRLESFAGFLVLNLLLGYASGFGLPWISKGISAKIRYAMVPETKTRIVRKKASMTYICHESAEVSDLFAGMDEPYDFIWLCWQSGTAVVSSVLGIAGLLLYIAQIGWIAAGVFAAAVIPVIIVSVRSGNTYYDTWARTAGFRRRCRDLKEVLTNRKYAQEKLLFGYHDELLRRWKQNYETVRTDSVKEELKGAKRVTACGMLLCVVILGLMLYMVRALVDGSIGLGMVISVISVFPAFLSQVVVTLSNQLNTLSRAHKQVCAFDAIMALPDEEDAFEIPLSECTFERIVFEDVSFRYPSSEAWILRHVSFEIKRGQHYALVGVNGAGKTTLIKLLMRLYRATEGRILVDGKDICELPRRRVMGLVSALFQDYARYAQTAGDNIGIGDMNSISDREAIKTCARLSGASAWIEKFDEGYETMLSSIFEGGVDLSGGEWQKIAIARLLHAKTPIKILDEPTAALDPFSEMEIYRGFQKIMQGTTTLTISHRLASCRYADIIFVLNRGHISEQGTHEQLMESGGLYAQMYQAQREMYER